MKKLVSLILTASMTLTAAACVFADEAKSDFSHLQKIGVSYIITEEKPIEESLIFGIKTA